MGGYAQFPSSMEYTLAYISSDEPANLMLQQTMSWWGSNYKSAYRYGHSREICEKQTIWSKGPYGSLKVYETVLGYGVQSIFVPKMDQFKEIANAIIGSYYGRQVAFAFTTDKTLLNRAEAYVLSKQYDKAVNDLQYWYRIKAATKVPDKDELNLFYETVDPTTNGKPLDPKFALEAGLQTNLLKAVIHARRIETVHEGERWQDIKRFGIEISHNIENESPIVLKAHDLRKAVQIPASVVEAGLFTVSFSTIGIVSSTGVGHISPNITLALVESLIVSWLVPLLGELLHEVIGAIATSPADIPNIVMAFPAIRLRSNCCSR